MISLHRSSLIAVLFFANSALASFGTRGGGNAVVCFENENEARQVRTSGFVNDDLVSSVSSIEMLDLYEAKLPRGFDLSKPSIIQIEGTETAIDYIKRLSNWHRSANPLVAEILLKGLDTFPEENVLIHDSALKALDDTDKAFEISKPECALITLAVQESAANGSYLEIDGRLFSHEKHSRLSRAILLLHEILYARARSSGETNSRSTRELVALLITKGSKINQSVLSKFKFMNNCPHGYVPVPPLAPYTSREFCLAKYEAKPAANVAASVPIAMPWFSATLDVARQACRANGPGFALVTNDEWQTVARNIESVKENWSGYQIGSAGGLNTGHSEATPQLLLAASENDNEACAGLNRDCNQFIWDRLRRTHVLSNGAIVWDLSGNVWEWVDESTTLDYGPSKMIAQVSNEAPFTNLAKDTWGPAGDYRASLGYPAAGLGKGFFASPKGGVLRGSSIIEKPAAGIFSTFLSIAPNEALPNVGFRCAYHPEL